MHRRAFLGSAASSFILPACATVPAAPSVRRDCLPPVNVAPDRVIRTVAGLRPYRASGFVVRGEALGDKRLVHNYGHGGAGITLSWGTSKLATELGLPGHQGAVAVIGAGIVGLTTARLAQEAGFAVTIYAAALPPDTTSNIAGGQIVATGLFDNDAVSPAWLAQLGAAMDYSWRRFQIMVGPDYGVRWLPTYEETRATSLSGIDRYRPGLRLIGPDAHPFPVERMRHYTTMYVETGRFLHRLLRDFEIAGGRIAVRNFATPADLVALPERLIFNCTGLGARALFGDEELRPIRGQLAVLLPQPEIEYAYAAGGAYMFPRADGIVLGGTFERDQWEAAAQPADIARIVATHQQFVAGFRCGA